jgi:hypothetical protein
MPRQLPRFIDSQVLAELSQIAPETRRQLVKYAARRVRMVAAAGCPVASDEPDILIADAIADTLTGVVSWDRRYHLTFHLCSVVRTRTWNEIMQAKRRPRVRLETASDDDDLSVFLRVDGRGAPSRPDVLLAIIRTTRELHAMLRRNVIRDGALLAMLDAYAHGCVKPREVMKFASMTRAEFLNARRRLDRALGRLPAVFQRAAQDVIRDG